MKNLILSLIVAVSCIVPPQSCYAQPDPLSSLAGGATLGAAISGLQGTINGIINNFGYEGRSLSFQTLQHAQLLLENMEIAYGASLNKTMSQLNATERDALQRADALVKSLSQETGSNLTKMQSIADQVDALVATLPLTKNGRITRYSPVLTTASQTDGQQIVKIRGTGFTKNATLSVGTDNLVPTGFMDTELTFAVPAKYFIPNKPKIDFRSLTLTLENKDQNFVDWITGQNRTYQAKLFVYVLPSRIGTYSISFHKTVTKSEAKPRSSGNVGIITDSQSVPFDSETKRDLIAVHATPGWKIDTSSITWNQTSTAGDWQFNGFKNITPSGFGIDLYAHAPCCWKGRGWIYGEARFVERREYQEGQDVSNFSSGNLEWGKDVDIQLPPETDSFTLQLDSFDGTRKIASGRDTLPHLADVDYDRNAKKVFIRVAGVEQAKVVVADSGRPSDLAEVRVCQK